MRKNGKNINCLICGKEFYVSKTDLGVKKFCTKECYYTARKKMDGNNRKEYGESSFNHLLAGYKQRAKRSKREFNLSNEDFKNLINGNCFYCGKEPSQIYYANIKTSFGEVKYNGIDRKYNKEGYTKDNSVSCCKECNYAKNILDAFEFIQLVKRIYNYLEGKCQKNV
jgi:hypothetical protein